MSFFCKFITSFFFLNVLIFQSTVAATLDNDFHSWLTSYKKIALKKGISQHTLDITFKDAKFKSR